MFASKIPKVSRSCARRARKYTPGGPDFPGQIPRVCRLIRTPIGMQVN